jgi:hypothetical protein
MRVSCDYAQLLRVGRWVSYRSGVDVTEAGEQFADTEKVELPPLEPVTRRLMKLVSEDISERESVRVCVCVCVCVCACARAR